MSAVIALFGVLIGILVYAHILNQLRYSCHRRVTKEELGGKNGGPTSEGVDELCRSRQPFVFAAARPNPFALPVFPGTGTETAIGTMTWSWRVFRASIVDNHVPLPANQVATLLLSEDPAHGFWTAHNDTNEVLIAGRPWIEAIDAWARPPLCVTSQYDLLSGCRGTCTDVFRQWHDRCFLSVQEGQVVVELHPPSLAASTFATLVGDDSIGNKKSRCSESERESERALDVSDGSPMLITLMPQESMWIPAFWSFRVRFVTPRPIVFLVQHGTVANWAVAQVRRWIVNRWLPWWKAPSTPAPEAAAAADTKVNGVDVDTAADAKDFLTKKHSLFDQPPQTPHPPICTNTTQEAPAPPASPSSCTTLCIGSKTPWTASPTDAPCANSVPSTSAADAVAEVAVEPTEDIVDMEDTAKLAVQEVPEDAAVCAVDEAGHPR